MCHHLLIRFPKKYWGRCNSKNVIKEKLSFIFHRQEKLFKGSADAKIIVFFFEFSSVEHALEVAVCIFTGTLHVYNT